MTREYPTVEYPTIVRGVVYGLSLRLECLDGTEMVLSDKVMRAYPDLIHDYPGITFKGDRFRLENAGPFLLDGKTFGICHQQKYSNYGWLQVNPDCYHHWLFWKNQQLDVSGGWIPGTERGIYFRKPFSWRWDVAGTNGKHWIWTKGYLGGHWD